MGLTKVSTDGVKDDAITAGKIPANAVGASELADNSVDSAAISADAVHSGKIADDAIGSEHIQDSAVTSSLIASDAIHSGKIADDAVGSEHIQDQAITSPLIAPNAVVSAKIADQAVTLDKLPHGTSSNNGKFLRANIGADPTFESLPASGLSNIVEDTTPQLGGNLDCNNKVVTLNDSSGADNNRIKLGNGGDLSIYHDGTDNRIDATNGHIYLRVNGTENAFKGTKNGNVEISYDGAKKFETTSYGTIVTGYQSASSYVGFHVMGHNQDHGFGTNHGSGITTYDVTYYSPIPMFSNKTIDHGSSYLSFPSYAGGNYIKFTAPVAGLYQLELIASVESHHGGDWCQMGWEINTTSNDNSTNFMNNNRGVLAVNQRAGDDTEMGCHFSTTIYMAANDYAVLYQQSTAAVRWRGNQYYVRGHLI